MRVLEMRHGIRDHQAMAARQTIWKVGHREPLRFGIFFIADDGGGAVRNRQAQRGAHKHAFIAIGIGHWAGLANAEERFHLGICLLYTSDAADDTINV